MLTPYAHNFILVEGAPVHEPDFLKWAMWFEKADRTLQKSLTWHRVRVSTVFLALNHQFGGGPPVLWETLIFGGELDGHQWRYSSAEEALQGHQDALLLAQTAKGPRRRGRIDAKLWKQYLSGRRQPFSPPPARLEKLRRAIKHLQREQSRLQKRAI